MNLIVHRRAEVALRSLAPIDQKKIINAFEKIEYSSFEDLAKSRKFKKIRVATGEKLYLFQGTKRLRIVLSKESDSWIVEDIVDHDRLSRLLPKGGRP